MGSNRLFVTKEDTFTLTLLYTKDGDLSVSRVEDVIESERDRWEKFEIEFAMPDFATAKGIMRNSIDYDGATQVVNMGAFNNAMMATLIKRWNLTDTEGKEIACNLSKLNELRPDIVRSFVELLNEKLQKEGIYQAIMLS